MQFNTGTAHLLETTRFLVNDPASAANNQYTDQEVKDSINFAYMSICNEIMQRQPMYFVKIEFADTVANQQYYALPDEFSRMIEVAIDYDGGNLDTGNTSTNETILTRVPYKELERVQNQASSTQKVFAFLHNHFRIYPEVTTAGTKSMRLVYEFEPVYLSADSDVPLFPAQHHQLIAVKAAIWLMDSRGLDTTNLQRQDLVGTRQLYNTILQRDIGNSDQFPSQAIVGYDTVGNQGFVK